MSRDEEREALRARIAEDVRAFKAAGGVVEQFSPTATAFVASRQFRDYSQKIRRAKIGEPDPREAA